VTVTAFEDRSGFGGNWHLIAQAICAFPVTNMRRVSRDAVLTPTVSTTKTTVAICSIDGTSKIIGTGFDIQSDATPGNIFINQADIAGDLSSVAVAASVDDLSPSWNLTGYAICAAPIGDTSLILSTSRSDSTSPKAPNALCPLNTFVHGIGFARFALDGTVFKDLIPTSQIAVVGNSGLTAAGIVVVENDSTITNWQARISVICAP